MGLISHTKGDALETVDYLLGAETCRWPRRRPEAIVEHLAGRGVEYTQLEGWLALDEHERALGEKATAAGGSHGVAVQRERIKAVPREDMVEISRGAAVEV